MIGQETVNEFNNGGSHRVNPYRGVPIGGNNRAEEDETSVEFPDGKYIFSNKLFINNIDDEFPMKLPEDMSFAEASMYIGDQFKEGSKIDLDTEIEILSALRLAQDRERNRLSRDVETNEFGKGGLIGTIAGGLIGGAATIATGGAAAPAIPALMNVGGKIGGSIDENNAQNKANEDIANQQLLAERANETSPFATKVFPLGGLIPYGDGTSQIPQDTTKTNAYTDTTLNKQMIDAIPTTLQTKNDTLPQFTLPRRDTLKEYANGGPLGNALSTIKEYGTPAEPMPGTLSDNLSLGADSFQGLGTDFNKEFTETKVGAANQVNEALASGSDKGFFGKAIDNIGVGGLIGAGTQLATGIGQNIAGLASTRREDPVPKYDIAQERNPNKFYNDEIRRAIIRNQSTQTQALANRSGGNFGQFASNVAAIGAAGSNAMGQSFVQQQQINNQESLATDQFNFRQRAIQARSDRQADDLDARNEGAYQNQRNAYRDAIFANIGSFGESLSVASRGNIYLEELMKNARLYGLDTPVNQ